MAVSVDLLVCLCLSNATLPFIFKLLTNQKSQYFPYLLFFIFSLLWTKYVLVPLNERMMSLLSGQGKLLFDVSILLLYRTFDSPQPKFYEQIIYRLALIYRLTVPHNPCCFLT